MPAEAVTIEGLSELRGRLRLTSKNFDYAIRIAVKRSGQRAAKEAKGLLPARSPLIRSIGARLIHHPIVSEVASSASDARVMSIHLGRRPGEAPSMKAIARWRKGRGLEQLTREERSEVWKIVAAIRVRGTRPIPFLHDALARATPEINRYLTEAFEYIMRKLAKA